MGRGVRVLMGQAILVPCRFVNLSCFCTYDSYMQFMFFKLPDVALDGHATCFHNTSWHVSFCRDGMPQIVSNPAGCFFFLPRCNLPFGHCSAHPECVGCFQTRVTYVESGLACFFSDADISALCLHSIFFVSTPCPCCGLQTRQSL